MDLVSNLIENNVNQAIALNQILEKNENQINNICVEQKKLENYNSSISSLLKTWSGWWNRIWDYSSHHNDIEDTKSITTNVTRDAVNSSTEKDINLVEGDKLDKNVKLLKELSNKMSINLDLQNEMLDTVNTNNHNLETELLTNQRKINKLL